MKSIEKDKYQDIRDAVRSFGRKEAHPLNSLLLRINYCY